MVRVRLPALYPILDTAALEQRAVDPVSTAAAMLEGGAEILQFRHKAFWSREVHAQAEKIADLCRQANAIFVVNDRADYAHILHAGLHLGQEDLLPQDARKVVGAETIIGFSTHNAEQMRAAAREPVDYVAFGPVFTTASKERPDPIVGLEILRQVRAMTDRPLVAIGGITMEAALACRSAGADSVAVIAGLLPSPCTPESVRECIASWIGLLNAARA
jgi:thiamine-phosphate pyrophosphorylase